MFRNIENSIYLKFDIALFFSSFDRKNVHDHAFDQRKKHKAESNQ